MIKNLKSSNILELISRDFGFDRVMLVVTATGNVPSVRSVDSFFYKGAFYIVSDTRTNYVKEIMGNENVMISDGEHNRFWCKTKVLGHPLLE